MWGAVLSNYTCRKPNVKVRVTWIDGRPVVIFEAKRTIQAGEELVWDYNDGKANGFWMSRARCRIEAQEGEPIDPCRCGPSGVCPDGKGMIPIEMRRRLQGQAPRRGSIRSKVSGPPPPLQRKGAVTGAVQGAMGRVPAGLGAGKRVKGSVLLGAGRGPGQTAWTWWGSTLRLVVRPSGSLLTSGRFGAVGVDKSTMLECLQRRKDCIALSSVVSKGGNKGERALDMPRNIHSRINILRRSPCSLLLIVILLLS